MVQRLTKQQRWKIFPCTATSSVQVCKPRQPAGFLQCRSCEWHLIQEILQTERLDDEYKNIQAACLLSRLRSFRDPSRVRNIKKTSRRASILPALVTILREDFFGFIHLKRSACLQTNVVCAVCTTSRALFAHELGRPCSVWNGDNVLPASYVSSD